MATWTLSPSCSAIPPSEVFLPYDHWRQLAAMTDVLGRFQAAAALLIASIHRCHIFTGRPDWYAALGDDPPIVRF